MNHDVLYTHRREGRSAIHNLSLVSECVYITVGEKEEKMVFFFSFSLSGSPVLYTREHNQSVPSLSKMKPALAMHSVPLLAVAAEGKITFLR